MADEENQPDERPRPKYGELAPPGWRWQPPQDADRLDTARPAPAAEEPAQTAAPGQQLPHPLPSAAPQQRAGAPRWNLTLTVLLLVVGLFGFVLSLETLQELPAAMQLMHQTQNLGDYQPAEAVGPLLTAGSIVLGGLWAVSSGLSVWLLVRKRWAFFVPLTAGFLAIIVLFVIAGAVFATDPVLLDFYRGLTPAPTSTPTPVLTTTATILRS